MNFFPPSLLCFDKKFNIQVNFNTNSTTGSTLVIFIVWQAKLPLDFDSLKSYSPNNHNLRGKNI